MLKLTNQNCPPRAARGLGHSRVGAAYGTGKTVATAMCAGKPAAIILPSRWVYRAGKAGQGFVKGTR